MRTAEDVRHEYADVLAAIGEIGSRRAATWPAVQPVLPGDQAIELGLSAEALAFHREEAERVSRLAQLEDAYQILGGDPQDLYRLALQ